MNLLPLRRVFQVAMVALGVVSSASSAFAVRVPVQYTFSDSLRDSFTFIDNTGFILDLLSVSPGQLSSCSPGPSCLGATVFQPGQPLIPSGTLTSAFTWGIAYGPDIVTFDGINFNFPSGALGAHGSYAGAAGETSATLVVSDVVTAVPEPLSLTLLGTALFGLGAVRSRFARRG